MNWRFSQLEWLLNNSPPEKITFMTVTLVEGDHREKKWNFKWRNKTRDVHSHVSCTGCSRHFKVKSITESVGK